MYNKNDPLVHSVKGIMEQNELRRRVEAKLCEELGIYSRKALPREHVANYDALLEQRINEVKKSLPSYIEKGAKSARDMGNYAGMLQYQGTREKGEEGKSMLDQAKKLDSKSRTRAEYVGKAAKKLAKEELVGNQHKIDANKNNRVDAHDFKLLRAKKEMQEQDDGEETREGGAVTRDGKPVVSPTATRAGETSARRPPQEGASASERQALTNKIKSIIKESMHKINELKLDTYNDARKEAKRRKEMAEKGDSPVDKKFAKKYRETEELATRRMKSKMDEEIKDMQSNQPTNLDKLKKDLDAAAPNDSTKTSSPDDSPIVDKPAKSFMETNYKKLNEKASEKQKEKVAKVMGEFKKGKLHSGSKKGPEVTSRKQAVAIALSQAGLSKKKMEEDFDLEAVMEEIARNLFSKINALKEANDEIALQSFLESLTEEQLAIMNERAGMEGVGSLVADYASRGLGWLSRRAKDFSNFTNPTPQAGARPGADKTARDRAIEADDQEFSRVRQQNAAQRPGTTGQPPAPAATPTAPAARPAAAPTAPTTGAAPATGQSGAPVSGATSRQPFATPNRQMSPLTARSADRTIQTTPRTPEMTVNQALGGETAERQAAYAARSPLSSQSTGFSTDKPSAPSPAARTASSSAARPAASSAAPATAPEPKSRQMFQAAQDREDRGEAGGGAAFFAADKQRTAELRGMQESKSLTSTINKILKG